MAGGNPAWPQAILDDDRIVKISDELRFVGAAALMQDSLVSPFLLLPGRRQSCHEFHPDLRMSPPVSL